MFWKKLLVIVGILGLGLAAVSFVGGSVGAIITGREPLSVFRVASPHVELAAGKPFPGFPVTNTMIAAWVTVLVLLVLFFTATRRMKLVPSGLQNLVEFLCETASGFMEDIAGKENERKFFPVVLTIFLFVLLNAWIGLIPGFETIRVNGVPLLRSANTDINVPLMLALVAVTAVEYWGFRARKVSYLKTFLDFGEMGQGFVQLLRGRIETGLGGILRGIIAAFVGVLEILSHLVRVVSFTFRLFGNMMAGVILTGVMIFIVPLVIPSVFYGLKAFLGLIQALIFGGLTLVFGYAAVTAAEQ